MAAYLQEPFVLVCFTIVRVAGTVNAKVALAATRGAVVLIIS